ncbi:phage protein [Vibrio algicola]|uniref:DUF2597 family protein n=1 Tax=Vibrio algicola TaxID=2662262 RepID=A0A5Q0TCZ7_9VIBR|nr:phage protein [Vibrio algicola]
MGRRISGSSFDTELLGETMHIEKATVTITDNSAVALTNGIPDGFIDGDVAAEIELEVSTKYLPSIIKAAKSAGSFRELDTDDIMFFADTGSEELKVECFGVKLVMDSILDFESKGAEVLTHKLKGFVTSPDFVHIGGVPYLSDDDTRNLLG